MSWQHLNQPQGWIGVISLSLSLDQNVFGEAAGSLPALARVSSRSLGQLFALCLDVPMPLSLCLP